MLRDELRVDEAEGERESGSVWCGSVGFTEETSSISSVISSLLPVSSGALA